MKLAKKSLSVVVVFMLGTFLNYANIKTISKSTKAVKVVFENVQKDHALTIFDEEGVILHKEKVSNDGDLVKFFDFSGLKDGKYKIEVDKDFEILVKTFEVKADQILLNESIEEIVFKPVVVEKNNVVLLSRINFDKAPLFVSIIYGDKLILEETLRSDERIIEKAYKLDAEKKGDYKVLVYNQNHKVVKEFTL